MGADGDAGRTGCVRVTFEQARYPVREGESALDALVRGGANIAFSCRRGSCHVCMLRGVAGEVGEAARRGLSPELASRGYFLPCQAHPTTDIDAERPDPAAFFQTAVLAEKEALAPNVTRLAFEVPARMSFESGQFVNLRVRGLVRSYSIASVQRLDYFLELHVKREPGGALSPYLCDELAIGAEVELQGPLGSSVYVPGEPDRELLLLGTGSGLAPLWGVARDALDQGHRGQVWLYHGARDERGLYLRDRLQALAAQYANFHYVPCSSAAVAPEVAPGRVTRIAFDRHRALEQTRVYLAGSPAMVHEARHRAVLAGVESSALHSDPFETAAPYMPDDTGKMAALPPDPEIWEALERGPGLTKILTDFYGVAFRDPRLKPFFHNVTIERAIEKQFEFLRELFARDCKFFGLKPFNAHHWMVISDELFDYRERLIEAAMRRYGLAPHLIRRWLALHELFRREIVKSRARGLIVDGVEHLAEGFSVETLEVASLCDGCQSEMLVGARGRMHRRTGQLYCEQCAARAVGGTLPPRT